MTTMVAEIYDALIDAGASEEKARKAAEVLTDYDSRFAAIERKLDVLTWSIGVNAAMVLAVLFRVFLH